MQGLPDPLELAEAPAVKLGGKPVRVPRMALGQIKRIVPAVTRHGSIDFADLRDADFDLLYDVCYWGLSRVEPELTREAFDARCYGFSEVVLAFPVIVQQSGAVLGNARGNDLPVPSAPAIPPTPTGTA